MDVSIVYRSAADGWVIYKHYAADGCVNRVPYATDGWVIYKHSAADGCVNCIPICRRGLGDL